MRWHCRQEGSETPADRWLDEAEATISEGVREMACRLNQDSASFEKTARIWLVRRIWSISKRRIAYSAFGVGMQVGAANTHRGAHAPALRPDRARRSSAAPGGTLAARSIRQ